MEQQFEECVRLWNEYNGMLVHYNEPNDLLSQELQHVYDNFAPLEPLMEVERSIICDNLLAKETELVQKVIECTDLLLHSGYDVRSRLKYWKVKQKWAQIGFTFSDKDTELAAIDSE
uniref:Uncharacterized protein n=1 Tax=Plectus sambesii TaxID=2011161 RepID=A0A914WSA2_9BILA